MSSNHETVSTLLHKVCATCGEGPHWDEKQQCLYFVSIIDANAYCWCYNSQKLQNVCFSNHGKSLSFIIPRKNSIGEFSLLGGLDQKIIDFKMKSDEHQILHEVENGLPTRFNDAKCDPLGRLLAGTMSLESSPAVLMAPGNGSLYGLSSENELQVLDKGFDLSNGLAWTADSSKLFFVDSVPRKVYAYDYDSQNFAISNQRVAIDFNKWSFDDVGLPDGMCMDAYGHLWIACYSAGKIICFDTNTSQRLREIKFAAPNITSCCFGGPQLDELFVTSSRFYLPSHEVICGNENVDGSVFKVTNLGVKGLPASVFCG